jgi:hypothetical protein
MMVAAVKDIAPGKSHHPEERALARVSKDPSAFVFRDAGFARSSSDNGEAVAPG